MLSGGGSERSKMIRYPKGMRAGRVNYLIALKHNLNLQNLSTSLSHFKAFLHIYMAPPPQPGARVQHTLELCLFVTYNVAIAAVPLDSL